MLNNIATANQENIVNNKDESCKKRIYSDCYSSYLPSGFSELGYILKRVNHSVWFGYVSFHANTIESLWDQVNKYINNFFGLSIEALQKNLIIMKV